MKRKDIRGGQRVKVVKRADFSLTQARVGLTGVVRAVFYGDHGATPKDPMILVRHTRKDDKEELYWLEELQAL